MSARSFYSDFFGQALCDELGVSRTAVMSGRNPTSMFQTDFCGAQALGLEIHDFAPEGANAGLNKNPEPPTGSSVSGPGVNQP